MEIIWINRVLQMLFFKHFVLHPPPRCSVFCNDYGLNFSYLVQTRRRMEDKVIKFVCKVYLFKIPSINFYHQMEVEMWSNEDPYNQKQLLFVYIFRSQKNVVLLSTAGFVWLKSYNYYLLFCILIFIMTFRMLAQIMNSQLQA